MFDIFGGALFRLVNIGARVVYEQPNRIRIVYNIFACSNLFVSVIRLRVGELLDYVNMCVCVCMCVTPTARFHSKIVMEKHVSVCTLCLLCIL